MPTALSDQDLYLFNEGSHVRLYDHLGSRVVTQNGETGTRFSVWAPDAESVSVIGDFNDWDGSASPLRPRDNSGIWEGFLPGVEKGACYKYKVRSRYRGYAVEKSDPFAIRTEIAPKTASIVWDLDYQWKDSEWMRRRGKKNSLHAPISIYEVHLGSWIRSPETPDQLLSYRDIAGRLADYAAAHGFTHVEFMPLMEHPFYGSWGYQSTGYFAATSRYGTPQDFMHLIDELHARDIGVILDWVPSHFPEDQHALGYFDGTHLYEHQDPKLGFHPDWKSLIFNYGRNEVRSFLLSSALFWIDKFHADGLRVDAVASMLYLDYSRNDGEWIPNKHGGRENLEAISFLRRLNEEVYKHHPDVQTFAEESTDWPMVSRPTYVGGLGFGLKWDMGWMHDTLDYFSKDPVHRRFHHNEITFRMVYAFHESFILPLSHDEVVHGKGSLLDRMPGDPWQKFANLRTLYGYMFAQPGKKLLFMGCEFAHRTEWRHDESLDWDLLDQPEHKGIQRLVGHLNKVYKNERALHELDCDPDGFEWIDANDSGNSVLCFLRWPRGRREAVAVILNLTPVPRENYRVGLPWPGKWTELLNSDAKEYGGSGIGNAGGIEVDGEPFHGRPHSAILLLPPLSIMFLRGSAP